jgi:hypothetical protein
MGVADETVILDPSACPVQSSPRCPATASIASYVQAASLFTEVLPGNEASGTRLALGAGDEKGRAETAHRIEDRTSDFLRIPVSRAPGIGPARLFARSLDAHLVPRQHLKTNRESDEEE